MNPRLEPGLSGITFRNEEVREHQRAQYLKFYQCPIIPTRYVGIECLHKLGLLDSVWRLLINSDLEFVCTQNLPTYESLTLEFLSSFSYNPPCDESQHLSGSTTFRMFNNEYYITQTTLSDSFHFPREGVVHHRIPTDTN